MTLRDLVSLTTYELNHERASNSKVLKIRPRKNFKRFSFVVKGNEDWSSKTGWVSTLLYPSLKEEDFERGSGVTPMDSDVLVYCTCDAYLYWGSKYWGTQDDYNIKVYKENRPPYVRDPHKERYVCKHIIRASRYMRKKGFNYFSPKILNNSSSKEFASMDHMRSIISQFMRKRYNASNEDVDNIILSLNEDNLESRLEECGIYPTLRSEEGRSSLLDSIINKDVLW